MRFFAFSLLLSLLPAFPLTVSAAVLTSSGTPDPSLHPAAEVYNSAIQFGVVLRNSTYNVYRSGFLGERGLGVLREHLEKNNLPFPKTIVHLNHQGFRPGKIPVVDSIPFVNQVSLNNFAMEEYHLQEEYGFQFLHPYHPDETLRTYLDGDNPYLAATDIDVAKYMGPEAQQAFGLRTDGKPDGDADDLVRIMRIVLDPARQPVLFHCFGGMHRTGIVGMTLRQLQGGDWTAPRRTKVDLGKEGSFILINKAHVEYFNYTHWRHAFWEALGPFALWYAFRPSPSIFMEQFATTDEFRQLDAEFGAAVRGE